MADPNAPAPDNASAAPAPANNAPSMDPDTAADIIAVVFSRAVQDGMDPGFKSFTIAVGENGDASVASESAAGTKYEGIMSAGDIAADLGMEAEGDAAEAPPA